VRHPGSIRRRGSRWREPRARGRPRCGTATDPALDLLAANFNQEYAAAAPFLRRGLAAWTAWAGGVSEKEEMRALCMAGIAAQRLWDDDGYQRLASRYVQLARDAGSLSELPLALLHRGHVHLFSGELTAAATVFAELQAVADATGALHALHRLGPGRLALLTAHSSF
jgi:hypothetical protein